MALDMTTALTIRAKVDGLGQVQGLGKALGTTEKQANGLAGAFGRLRGAATSMIGVLGAAGLGAILKQSVDTFAKFQAETKLLENGLKNINAEAGQLDKLQKIASDLGEATLFNEEDFRKGFALLTSFGEIGVNSYERVAKAAADVAYTSGTDVSSAFMQLAKALNDPAKGLTALGRSGIQFTEQQKELIEKLHETGQTAKAQELILKELERQYGGNAVAAAQGLAGAFDTLGEKMYDLQVTLGDNVAQVLQPLIVGLTTLVDTIANLPEPLQTVIVALGGLVIAMTALGGVIAIGAPVFSALAALGPILAGIPALIAGWSAVLGPLIGVLGTLGQVLVGIFTGPVGWIALVAAAGVAIYAFRDQIAQAFKSVYQAVVSTFQNMVSVLRAPFEAAAKFIGNIFNSILQAIAGRINFVIGLINRLIAGYNRLPTPDIPLIPQLSVPAFAAGGVVNRPTLAMVGEGGEREFIIPESKMATASANYLAGVRGGSVIPRGNSATATNGTVVNIRTGPVMQQDGQQYVTMGDLEGALQTMADTLLGNGRSAGGRRYAGIG